MENKTKTVSWFTVALPAVMAAVAILGIVDFRSGAWGRDTILAAFADSRGLPESLVQLDNLFRQQMPSGNIWIEFKGFSPERSSDKLFMELV
ncbi:MAG: hypothetical protein ABFD06_01795 [Smithella sp.]